jgi:uncharacterized protein
MSVATRPGESERLGATRRPEGLPVMKQRWAELLFLHWSVPAQAITALLPPGLEVDTFEGRAYVGLVPFTVTGARPTLMPALPGLSSFHEVNVRTYVHQAGSAPGVWFFSLDASNRLVVALARLSYKLPYRFARIHFTVREADPASRPPRRELRFVSQRVAGDAPDCEVNYGPTGAPAPASPGTLEHFLVERYVLYTASEGALYRARVYHAPYPLQPAWVGGVRESLVRSAGLSRPESEPLAHYASEVTVEVFGLQRL